MSMVLGIIKGFIGSWGLSVIDFYLANSLWINGILLLYALVISTCWRNYETVRKYIEKSIMSQLEPKAKSWSRTEITKKIRMAQISWEDVKKQLKVPLIAKAGSYIPAFASVETIKKLFPEEVIMNSIHNSNKKQEV